MLFIHRVVSIKWRTRTMHAGKRPVRKAHRHGKNGGGCVYMKKKVLSNQLSRWISDFLLSQRPAITVYLLVLSSSRLNPKAVIIHPCHPTSSQVIAEGHTLLPPCLKPHTHTHSFIDFILQPCLRVQSHGFLRWPCRCFLWSVAILQRWVHHFCTCRRIQNLPNRTLNQLGNYLIKATPGRQTVIILGQSHPDKMSLA